MGKEEIKFVAFTCISPINFVPPICLCKTFYNLDVCAFAPRVFNYRPGTLEEGSRIVDSQWYARIMLQDEKIIGIALLSS